MFHTHNWLSNGLPQKNLVLFYLLPSVPKAAYGKSPELRARAPEAESIVRVGKLKLTFHCFLCVCVCACVCVCVREVFGHIKYNFMEFVLPVENELRVNLSRRVAF